MNRWLLEGLQSDSFWKRSLCVWLHDAALGAIITAARWVFVAYVIVSTNS